MKLDEKLKYLVDNHLEEYRKATVEATQKVDDKYPVFCPCGKLATGLHTRTCTHYIKQVDKEVVNILKNLLPK